MREVEQRHQEALKQCAEELKTKEIEIELVRTEFAQANVTIKVGLITS
jgi:rubrerythrin